MLASSGPYILYRPTCYIHHLGLLEAFVHFMCFHIVFFFAYLEVLRFRGREQVANHLDPAWKRFPSCTGLNR